MAIQAAEYTILTTLNVHFNDIKYNGILVKILSFFFLILAVSKTIILKTGNTIIKI